MCPETVLADCRFTLKNPEAEFDAEVVEYIARLLVERWRALTASPRPLEPDAG
jgi:hypothetical protein